ncbi:Metastasis-associated protein MTA1, partial [Schistosoma japonicum]
LSATAFVLYRDLFSFLSLKILIRFSDFVYFEVAAASPYHIRKIEELNKTPTGAVEAKVVCFYRRRDLSSNLVQLADKHQKDLGTCGDDAQPDILHQIHHRELFLSRHLETLPATHIRGKCTVTLHTETEPYHIYLPKEDTFFFQLVYDPLQKTLQADQGSIREGPQYQADIEPYYPLTEDSTDESTHEQLLWRPDNNLTPSDLDSYLLLIRSLATLGRSFYPPHILRQPSLTMSAAAAARDTTHQFALDTLHSANYNISQALQMLAPNGQPILKMDEMEQWSASEGNLFEEALEKYGKCFYEIQNDFLPWKYPKNLVEFYYMWKTTDHYVQQRRMKAIEAEHHLKQVYIPNYNKPNPTVLYPVTSDCSNSESGCDGCSNITSSLWYALGPSHSPLKVCVDCWSYWKRYGDLKTSSLLDKVSEPVSSIPTSTSSSDSSSLGVSKSNISLTELQSHTNSSAILPDRPSKSNDVGTNNSTAYMLASKVRTSVSFHFVASVTLRIARRLCVTSSPRRLARQPFKRLTFLTGFHKDALPLLSKLTPTESHKLTKRFRNISKINKSNPRGVALHSLVSRLHQLECDVSNGIENVLIAEPLSMTTENQIYSTSETAIDLAVNGLLTTCVSGNLKLPASIPSSDEHSDGESITIKKASATIAVDEANLEVISTSHGYINLGPKRRFTVGSGVDGASTLMYRASQLIKRSRRKFLPLTELRRFGRHPWFELNVDLYSPNGLHSVSSNLKRKSHAVTSSTTAETDRPNAGIVTSSSSAH